MELYLDEKEYLNRYGVPVGQRALSELNLTLKLHKMWLNGHKDGRRANFYGCDFGRKRHADLDLSYAFLDGASLWNCDLANVNFDGASLWGANFGTTNMFGCTFNKEHLSQAWFGSGTIRQIDKQIFVPTKENKK